MASRPIGHRGTGKGYTRVVRSKIDKSRINGMMGIHSMVKLQSPQSIRRLLTSKGLVPVRRLCHRCGWKVKKGDYERRSGDYGYRCTNTSCRIRITRFHGFQLSRYGLELSQQAAMISSIIHATSLVNTHVQLGISHGAIESMALRLRQHIQRWVTALGFQWAHSRQWWRPKGSLGLSRFIRCMEELRSPFSKTYGISAVTSWTWKQMSVRSQSIIQVTERTQ